jgi:hypothetical protein
MGGVYHNASTRCGALKRLLGHEGSALYLLKVLLHPTLPHPGLGSQHMNPWETNSSYIQAMEKSRTETWVMSKNNLVN